jgi:transposase
MERSLERRIRDPVTGHPSLETIAEALLSVRAVLLRQFNGFEKRVRTMARAVRLSPQQPHDVRTR